MQRRLAFFLLLTLFFAPLFTHAADVLQNVGIIPGNIWYSNYPLQGGVEVKVYTAVFNGSVYTVEGVVSFTDNGQALSRAPFLIPPGQLHEVSIVWVPTQGSHKVSAAITDIKTVAQGKSAESATLETVVTAQGTVSVAPPPPPPKQTPVASLTTPGSVPSPVSQLGDATKTLGALASSTGARVVNAAEQVLPRVITDPVKKAASAVNVFAKNTKKQVDVSKGDIKLSLASEKARDNLSGKSALSQVSAIASIAPLRFLASLYDKATNALSSWVLGDLPAKVTAAKEGGSGVKKPFDYLRYFALSLVAFVLDHLWLLWLLMLSLLFLLLRFMYRKLFRRHAYY